MFNIRGDDCHDYLIENIKPELTFDKNKDFELQKKLIKEKFIETFCLDEIEKNDREEMLIEILNTKVFKDFTQYKVIFSSEKDVSVLGCMLIPNNITEKAPLCIVLQGHNNTYLNSFGEGFKYQDFIDDKQLVEDSMLAIQAVKKGYCALAIEQRSIGQSYSNSGDRRYFSEKCSVQVYHANAIGRTVLGERVFDVKKSIDFAGEFARRYNMLCDVNKVIITGNGAGGTTAYYSSIYDDRISVCVPSCAFSTYKDSIYASAHCECEYIPRAYLNYDMQDLSIAIAPRKLIVVSGKDDEAYPLKGAKKAFDVVKEIFDKAGAKDNCKHVITDKGHRWCPDVVWLEIETAVKELGW